MDTLSAASETVYWALDGDGVRAAAARGADADPGRDVAATARG
jgi:hypothetical protein